jgi:hypothetical protein
LPDFKRHQESAAEPVRTLEPFGYARTWQCTCGAKLTLKSRKARAEGPSNFIVDINPKNSTFGHSLVPSGRLNWEGLREERGYERDGDVVKCIACVMGRTLDEQRLVSRFQPHRVAAEIAARHITRQSGGTIQAEVVFTRLLPKG